MMGPTLLLVLGLLVASCMGDVYMHNPRGSNNRLNERSANRDNANRMFDSQNNNRGGYNAGDQKVQGGFSSEDEIYYMKYFQSGTDADTYLTIEWTNQHGCGGNEEDDPHKLNCNIVLQYMVQDEEPLTDDNRFTRIRDGSSRNTIGYNRGGENENKANYDNRRSNNVQLNRGMEEPFEFYDDCYRRERNKGLFTADQELRDNDFGVSSAIYTRQNPQGTRRGYECPEERDYYPYWHPTPWIDIAVLTDDITRCSYYESESYNAKPKGICRGVRFDDGLPDLEPYSQWNNQEDCEEEGGTWFEKYSYIETLNVNQATCLAYDNTFKDEYSYLWAPAEFGENPTCLVRPPMVYCDQAGWSRVNHLGSGRDGVPLNYTWKIPYFPSGSSKLAVVRIRYNISTDDYDPWNTDASSNFDIVNGVLSPVTNNPNVDVGTMSNKPLRLAVNTAQFGRTFQDRSHIMTLRPRSDMGSNPDAQTCDIYNLNVRGKRGNIVQTYPAVEYDFFPNRFSIEETDCLHIQWTGSNTHNNGNPAGDGQAGDAGEGTGGTDRHNIVQIADPNSNYPLPWEQATMFKEAEVLWSYIPNLSDPADLAVVLASAGYYQCLKADTCPGESVEDKDSMNKLLNNAPPSFEGVVVRLKAGVYHFICSRNNNFTNRSQKGMLTVTS